MWLPLALLEKYLIIPTINGSYFHFKFVSLIEFNNNFSSLLIFDVFRAFGFLFLKVQDERLDIMIFFLWAICADYEIELYSMLSFTPI